MRLILIEGLPGSGKSTTAKRLCDLAMANGLSARWYLEEAKDHPVHSLSIKQHKYERDFPERSLTQWRHFVSTIKDKDHLHILEGSLFQSSVRFMLEGNNQDLISNYHRECQDILSILPVKLIYLRTSDVSVHLNWIMRHRGAEWTSKVTSYLENTPFCSGRGWHGARCMQSFWGEYASLCESLVETCDIPCYTIEGVCKQGQLQKILQ